MMNREKREKHSNQRMYTCYAVVHDETNIVDRCHIFYEHRMLDIPDGLPKWSGMENTSDLLDDHGKPIKQAK